MDKYDEMLSELEKQQKEIKDAIEKIERAKRLPQCIAPKCGNCRHFYQHYIISNVKNENEVYFCKVSKGHCSYPRLKDRNEDDVCNYFEPKEKRFTDDIPWFKCTSMR